jgi:hypothetical protein
MKEQTQWIFQSRNVADPWAIHLMARKERRRIRASTKIYADWFTNPSKCFLIDDMSIVKTASWIDAIGHVLAAHDHPLTKCDREQLERDLNELKKNFLD